MTNGRSSNRDLDPRLLQNMSEMMRGPVPPPPPAAARMPTAMMMSRPPAPEAMGMRGPENNDRRSTVTVASIPPLPSPEAEFERIRRANSQPDPTLEGMRQQRQEQLLRMQGGRAGPASMISGPPPTQEVPSSYMNMYRDLCRNRPAGGSNANAERAVFRDPDYAEKRELLIKLDEMRTLGFNVPKLDITVPLEDLQTEVQRRTISMGTVETVDMFIGYISTGAQVLETVNNMAGPFVPMENYAQSVREGMQTPRFKYAMYQLVLRYQGRNGGSPWRVVLMVLIMPLIQGLLVKLVQWLAKGRFNLNSSMINTGIKTLFGKLSSSDPNKGVPNNIPGISPNVPKPTATTAAEPELPSMPGFKPNPAFTARAATTTGANKSAAETPTNPFARFASKPATVAANTNAATGPSNSGAAAVMVFIKKITNV